MERQIKVAGNCFVDPEIHASTVTVPSLYTDAAWAAAEQRPFAVVSVVLHRRHERVFIPQASLGIPHLGTLLPTIELGHGETHHAAVARLCSDYLGFRVSGEAARYNQVGAYSWVCHRHDAGKPAHFTSVVLAYHMRTRDIPRVGQTADGAPSPSHPYSRSLWHNVYDVIAPQYRARAMDMNVLTDFLR